jgi:hypothetical protein
MIATETQWVPASLDTMEPGHELACVLSTINIDECSGYDLIRVLRAHERMRSFHSAQLYEAMSAVVDIIDVEDMSAEYVEQAAAAEVAAALRLTRRTADLEMDYALEMRRRIPAVWFALLNGDIDDRRAKVIVNGTEQLPQDTARQVVDSLIGDAGRFTTGQLRARLRKLCIEVDPQDAERRYEQAVNDRCVTTETTDSGTSHFHAFDLSPERLASGMNRVNRIARGLRGKNERRSMDQLRADVFLDLLEGTGTATHSGRGMVDIHVTLDTLAELADHPGDLAGYGPVAADIARQVADQQRESEWRWTIDDPDTGLPLYAGTTRRRPSASQRRLVESRNPVCIHPGCRVPATQSDIDHTTPWAQEQKTDTMNLAPMCRYHHNLRHKAHWSYRTIGGGDYVFTTALGHSYTTSGRSP